MTLLPGGDHRYDLSRTGRPAWAKKADTGPLNTYVPGPITDEPLANSYHTDVRLIVSGVVFAGIVAFVLVRGQSGAFGAVAWLVGMWLVYAVPVWLRGRVGLRVDGPRCEVHGWLRTVRFAGEDVAAVRYVFAGRSPDVRLVLRDGRKVTVVASRLEKGHSTLFEWLRRYAPGADYDAKAIDIRDMLVTRGLMGAPGDAWDVYGPGRGSGATGAAAATGGAGGATVVDPSRTAAGAGPDNVPSEQTAPAPQDRPESEAADGSI